MIRPLTFALSLVPVSASAQSATAYVELIRISAWPSAVYDQDGDGYAAQSADRADRVTLWVDSRHPLSCLPGFVVKRGDRDDGNAAIHPRQLEVPGNGRDDDCDDRTDEPEPCYFEGGLGNTTSGFSLRVRVNDPQVSSTWSDGQGSGGPSAVRLDYAIEYQALRESSGAAASTVLRPVANLWSLYGGTWVEVGLSGLAAGTVYRARLQFYRSTRAGSGTWTSTVLGAVSDWYYTTTHNDSLVGMARSTLLLQGFYEYWLSEHLGAVGYQGSWAVDGTRYGTYEGDSWCTDFYSTLTTGLLSGMTHEVGTLGIRDYFQQPAFAAWCEVGSNTTWLDELRRGDFLALDTGGDGDINHTAMFLGYDAGSDLIWTLEGNTSGVTDGASGGWEDRLGANEVFVKQRTPDLVVGYGRIVASML